MPTSLGPAEILVILIVALIVLGPKKLPEAGRQVGKAIAEVRKWSQGFQDEIRGAMDPNASPPSYTQPQPGYQPPIPMVPAETVAPGEVGAAAPPVDTVDAAEPPVETNGASVRTGSHGPISGPEPAEATADLGSTDREPTDPAPLFPAPLEAAPLLPAPTDPPGPPAGDLPRT